MAIHAGSTAFALFCLLLFSALSTKWGLHAAMGSGVTTSGHLIKFGRSFLLFRSDNHYWNQEMDVRAFCQNVDKYARKQNACPSEGHKTLHIGTFSSPKIPTQDLSLSSLSFTSCPKEKTTETYKGHVAWVTPPFHVPFTLPPALHQQPPTSPPKECQTKKKKKKRKVPVGPWWANIPVPTTLEGAKQQMMLENTGNAAETVTSSGLTGRIQTYTFQWFTLPYTCCTVLLS